MTQTIEELQAEELTLEIAKLFPRQGRWTEKDYFSLPETNRIIELSKGRLVITPSPTDQHQKIIVKLNFYFYGYLIDKNLGEIRCSPLDVWLGPGIVRQPDIVFMSDGHRDRITDKCWGVPDLVVEVLSEGTARVDKEDKCLEYQKAGVSEYWIVNPFDQTIEIFTLENGAYIPLGKWGAGETAHSKLLAGFNMAVDRVFG